MSSPGAPDPIYTLRGAGSPITYMTFHVDDTTEDLYSGTQDGKIHIWDMEIRRIKSTLEAHVDKSVVWIDFTCCGKMITLGRDGYVNLWGKTEDGWNITDKVLTGAMGFCSGCLMRDSEDKELTIVPSHSTSVCNIYLTENLSQVGKLNPTAEKFGFVMSITACQSDGTVLIGYENGSIATWEISKFEMVQHVKLFEESVMCMDFNSDANKGFCGSVNNKIMSWTIEDKQIVKGKCVETMNAGFSQIRIRQDQKILATAGWDGNVRIFGVKKLKPLAVLTYHKESVQCLTFSKENLLACGSKDQHISLWKIY